MNVYNEEKDGDDDVEKKRERMYYKRVAKHYLADEPKKENREAILTSAAYHKYSKILVTGINYI